MRASDKVRSTGVASDGPPVDLLGVDSIILLLMGAGTSGPVWDATPVAGVTAADEFGREGFSGIVDAEP